MQRRKLVLAAPLVETVIAAVLTFFSIDEYVSAGGLSPMFEKPRRRASKCRLCAEPAFSYRFVVIPTRCPCWHRKLVSAKMAREAYNSVKESL